MVNFEEKVYRYKPDRDVAGLIIRNIVIAIIYFILIFILRYIFRTYKIEYGRLIFVLVVGYLIGAPIGIFSVIWDIYCNKKQLLQITESEIIYTYGVFHKGLISVPTSKVRSCSLSSGPMQRFFACSTLCIYTAGDVSEICFENIEKGEDARKTIMNLIL